MERRNQHQQGRTEKIEIVGIYEKKTEAEISLVSFRLCMCLIFLEESHISDNLS